MARTSFERWKICAVPEGYVGAQARQSHRALYANLKAWLAAASPSRT